jgi:hypothetical protein
VVRHSNCHLPGMSGAVCRGLRSRLAKASILSPRVFRLVALSTTSILNFLAVDTWWLAPAFYADLDATPDGASVLLTANEARFLSAINTWLSRTPNGPVININGTLVATRIHLNDADWNMLGQARSWTHI